MRFLLLLCAAATLFAGDAPLLNYYVVGNVSCKSPPCNGQVIAVAAVQKALLEVASAPRSGTELNHMLAGSGISIGVLERLRFIRRRQDGYVLNFPLFTAADVRKIRAVSVRYARALADTLIARRLEIESTLATYDAPGVDRKDVAFVVLGCFSLDWDGLKFSEERGFRNPPVKRPDGRYTPQAEERIIEPRATEYSRSSSFWRYGLPITIFGDGSQHTNLNEFEPQWKQVHNTMLSLRNSGRTDVEPASLLANAFVRQVEGRYYAAIPVLSSSDRTMVRELRRIGRDCMSDWFKTNFESLRSELSDTAPERAGVPFGDSFTGIWHYIFGQANAMLINQGLFARPRNGSTAVVFAPEIF